MTHKNADGNVRWAREKLNQSNVNTFVTAASEVWYAQRQYYYGKYNSKINKENNRTEDQNLRSGTLGVWPRGGVGPRGFKNHYTENDEGETNRSVI